MSDQINMQKNSSLIPIVGVVIIAIVIVIGWRLNAAPAQQTSMPDGKQMTEQVGEIPVDKQRFRNGNYQAEVEYLSPGGPDQLAVNLTVADNMITEVNITPKAGNQTSKKYLDGFAAEYKQYVIGKPLADLKLDRVSGASLTSAAFNNAVAKIREQAS